MLSTAPATSSTGTVSRQLIPHVLRDVADGPRKSSNNRESRMTKCSRISAVACFVVSMLASATLAAQSSNACVSATSPDAQSYRAGYGGMVSRTDAESVAQRSNLSLPTLVPSQVLIVSDTTTCRTASNAFDSATGIPAADEAPIVLQMGTQWIVIKRLKYRGARVNILFNQNFSTAQKRIWF